MITEMLQKLTTNAKNELDKKREQDRVKRRIDLTKANIERRKELANRRQRMAKAIKNMIADIKSAAKAGKDSWSCHYNMSDRFVDDLRFTEELVRRLRTRGYPVGTCYVNGHDLVFFCTW